MQAKLLEKHGLKAAIGTLWKFLDQRGLTVKKRMARPACKGFLTASQSAPTYPVSGQIIVPGQDGAFARTDPHKAVGVGRHFFDQDHGTPFDCQAIFPVHSQTTLA